MTTDCVAHKYPTRQTCQEYADVSQCSMQMQDETLHSNLKIRRQVNTLLQRETAKALKHSQVEGCLDSH